MEKEIKRIEKKLKIKEKDIKMFKKIKSHLQATIHQADPTISFLERKISDAEDFVKNYKNELKMLEKEVADGE